MLVNVGVVGAFVGVGLQPNPNGNDLQNAAAHGCEQIEFVFLGLGHDVQNADAQRANVLTLGGFFVQPGHVVLVE